MICNDRACGCAITSLTLPISGSGTPEDPWVIEQVEFTDLTTLQNEVANLQASMELLPGLYVAQVGDSMTGILVIDVAGSGSSLNLKNATDGPWTAFVRQDGTSIGYIGGFSAEALMRLWGQAGVGIRFGTNNVEVARIDTNGFLLLAKTATNIATTGAEVQPAGSISSTRSVSGLNFRSNKTGAADANGQIHFDVLSAGTTIGSITRATASTTAFNTSSDETWKTNIVEVDDQLALYWMRVVQPMLFEFIAAPGVTHVGYIAQRVAAAWPESIALGVVTPGYGSQEDRTWDEDGNETTPEGVYRSWQIDLSKFTPFLHAGLQAVDVRVSILEDFAINHEEAIRALETEVADLREDLTALQAVVIALTEG